VTDPADHWLAAAFAAHGQQVIVWTATEKLQRWIVATKQVQDELVVGSSTGRVAVMAVAPDGQQVALSWHEYHAKAADKVPFQEIRLWDLTAKQSRHRFTGHWKMVSTLAFSPDGRWLVTGGWDPNLRLWDVEKGHLQYDIDVKGRVVSTVFAPNGRYVACGTPPYGRQEERIHLLEVATGKILCEITDRSTAGLAFAPDSRTLASTNGSVSFWEIPTGRALFETVSSHRNPSTGGPLSALSASLAIIYSSDGKWIATVGRDLTICVWKAENGEQVHVLQLDGVAGMPLALSFTPDSKTLACVQSKCRIRLWDVATGKEKP
jgi:WD40 repeat protein